jgi:hypothetical protein
MTIQLEEIIILVEVRKAPNADHQVLVFGSVTTEIQIDWTGSIARIQYEVDKKYFSQVCEPKRIIKNNLSFKDILCKIVEEEDMEKRKNYNCISFVHRLLDQCCVDVDDPETI